MEEEEKQTPSGADESQTPPPGTEEEKQTPPGADESQTPPPGTEEDKIDESSETFKAAIDEIKAAYEEKIAQLNESHKKELDERTAVIKQLLTGNKSVDEATESMQTVSEQINKKRNYEF